MKLPAYAIGIVVLSAPAIWAQTPFVENFDSFDTSHWHKADGWTNGSPFDNGWRADHATITVGELVLQMDDVPCATDIALCTNKPYASGEYRTNGFYGYGRIEGRFQAAAGDGLVSSLFTYTGPSDGNPHDEIDIEILGLDPTKLHTNYFTNGVGGHESIIDLGFDSSLAPHDYAFEWTANEIRWFVDGALVHTESGPGLPSTPGRIMMNLWPVDNTASGWAGTFNPAIAPVTATYDSVSFALVPEPSSWFLLLTALPMIWSCRSRGLRTGK